VNVGGEAAGSSVSEYLTGDRNLVIVRASVQYEISEPANYLFHAMAIDSMLGSAGEAVLSGVLAGQPVDQALTMGKRDMALVIRDRLQALADRYRLGITVRSVDIAAVEPPPEVAEAFDTVIGALRERERAVNLARGYADRTLSQAGAEAQRIRDRAQASRDRSVLEAEGASERFLQLVDEYERSPELTARRLYLEAMAETMSRFRDKVIVDPERPLDLSIFREETP
jgi:membrane protease subunit HflK